MEHSRRYAPVQQVPPPPVNAGDFLLRILQGNRDSENRVVHPLKTSHPGTRPSHPLEDDPAIAAFGPSMPSGHNISPSIWLNSVSLPLQSHPHPPGHQFQNPFSSFPPGFPQNPGFDDLGMGNPTRGHLRDELGFLSSNGEMKSVNRGRKVMFGSFPCDIRNGDCSMDLKFVHQFTPEAAVLKPSISNEKELLSPPENAKTFEFQSPRDAPVCFSESSHSTTSTKPFDSALGMSHRDIGLHEQLHDHGMSSNRVLHATPASHLDESLMESSAAKHEEEDHTHREKALDGCASSKVLDDLSRQLLNSLISVDEINQENEQKSLKKSVRKEVRLDWRGWRLSNQRIRYMKSQMMYRRDMYSLNASFLKIYESLIPAEEEKEKQKKLLDRLEKLVVREWPEARLHVYGSCANSFSISKSDIDICLELGESPELQIQKSEMILKLAEILETENLQNVQALTRARVPIVKLKDPETGISCDICINNMLAVVNSRLLRDYGRIDVRLRQLAFIVKYWAKSRMVNEAYQGTLSSYAYVLMCVHLLQHRDPAILPCLQEMERTYTVTTGGVECGYFDRVEKLHGFGSRNRETVAHLVCEFFNYWAYSHDYADHVISVRTRSFISKRQKDWTRRVGHDRHLICIEDPFETAHDLGRVVDKFSVRVLRGEFERAADIVRSSPDPTYTLFQPYLPIPPH